MRGLSLVAASGGHSSSRCVGLSLSRPLLLRSTGSSHAGSVVVAHGPSCSAACGILPDQGSNPCPLHWQADSQPLRHQGSPSDVSFLKWGLRFNSGLVLWSRKQPWDKLELHLPRASVFFGEGRSNLQLLHLLRILNISKWEMFSFLLHYKFPSGLPGLCSVLKCGSREAFKHASRDAWSSSLSVRTATLKLEENLNFALSN